MRLKTFAISSATIFAILLYLLFKSPDCPTSPTPIAPSYQQVAAANKINKTTQPFTVYCITPTYARPVQKAELTRLARFSVVAAQITKPVLLAMFAHRIAQTIQLVPFIHWIIIEDAEKTSALVEHLLTRHSLNDRSTLLAAKTPADFKLKRKDASWMKPRGVEQRNKALAWVRENVKYTPSARSVVYFMDDDNTYSFLLFEEMKKIEAEKVAVWPVGLVGGLLVEKPVLDKDDRRVMGFNSVVSSFLARVEHFRHSFEPTFGRSGLALTLLLCRTHFYFYRCALDCSGVQSGRSPLIWPVSRSQLICC